MFPEGDGIEVFAKFGREGGHIDHGRAAPLCLANERKAHPHQDLDGSQCR